MSAPQLLVGAALLIIATPAVAQDHSMQGMAGMSGMAMPAPAAQRTRPAPRRATVRHPATTRRVVDRSHRSGVVPSSVPTGHDQLSASPAVMSGMDMGGMAMPSPEGTMPMPSGSTEMPTMPAMQGGTALPAGNAPPPPAPVDHYADRTFPAGAMDASRHQMMRQSGGQMLHQVMFNLAELQARRGRDGYRWEGEGWFGGDLNRLVVKSEGEGAFGERIDAAEGQLLYSCAIGPYFDLQAGIRHDFAPVPTRTFATVGVEGLAPYQFQTEAAAFLSTQGELLGRLEGWYDQRLTQRLVLQPRVELNLSAQDVPETRTGAGLVDAELGLRLRYEITRQFAPYVGVSYEARTGRSADFARADGHDPTITSYVAGVRFWF